MNRVLPRLPRRSALAAACLIATLPALAAEAAADATADSDVTTLDKINVKGERAEGYSVRKTTAGTRFELAPREIPQSVSIISHQRIEDQGLDDIIDVLANTTGVSSTQSDSERTEFYARGFYIDNYQFDGIPTTMVQNWSYGDSGLDLALYDRVEVVRGATGLMTGAGNPSASVNLVRKHADSAELTGSVSVNVGSWGRTRSTVDVTTPLNASGSVRARVIGSYLDTDAEMDRYQQRKTLGYAVIDADLTPDTQLSVGYDYQHKKATGVTWGGFPMWFSDGSPTDYPTSFNPSPDWTYWDTTSKRAFATLQHRFGNGWQVKVGATHDRTDADDKLFYPFFGAGFDKASGGGIVPMAGYYNTERKVDGVDGYVDGPFQLFGREHQFMAGASYNRREFANYGDFQTGWAPLDNYLAWNGSFPQPNWLDTLPLQSRGTITQKAAYAATRLSLAEPLKLILGARYTDWRSEGEGADRSHEVTTPYAGLVYTIDADWSAYASYTEIFQPQTARDRNDRYLDPVEGKSYEVGIKRAWFDDRLNAALSVFRIEQDNVAQLTNEPIPGRPGEFASVAARGTVSRGVEFELNGELAPGWNGSVGASRYVAKDASGADINTQLPQTTLKLYTSYTPRTLAALTFGGGVNWQNRIYYVDATYGRFEQEAYALVSAFARYRLADNVTVQANLNNLLDKKYYAQIYGYGAWGETRGGSLTFTWSF